MVFKYLLVLMPLVFSFGLRATVVSSSLQADQIGLNKGLYFENNNLAAFGDLFSVLEKMQAPTAYLKLAAGRVRSVIFKKLPDDVGGAYNSMTKSIYLPLELMDTSTRALKSARSLSDISIGTLYHELWHAYLDLVARPERNQIFNLYISQSQILYPDHALQYHDEAYAIFLDEILRNYLQMRKIFEKKTPEVRDRLRDSLSLKKIYEDSFSVTVNGYYFDNWRRRFITSSVNMPSKDRHGIVEILLQNRPPFEYEKAFPEGGFSSSVFFSYLLN